MLSPRLLMVYFRVCNETSRNTNILVLRTAEGKQTEVEALLHLGLVCHLTYNPARDQTRRALMTFCGRFWAAFTNGELAEVSIPYCGTAKLSRLLLYYDVQTLLWDSRP